MKTHKLAVILRLPDGRYAARFHKGDATPTDVTCVVFTESVRGFIDAVDQLWRLGYAPIAQDTALDMMLDDGTRVTLSFWDEDPATSSMEAGLIVYYLAKLEDIAEWKNRRRTT